MKEEDFFEPSFTDDGSEQEQENFSSTAKELGSGDLGKQPFWKFTTFVLIAGFSTCLYLINNMYADRINDLKEEREDYKQLFYDCKGIIRENDVVIKKQIIKKDVTN